MTEQAQWDLTNVNMEHLVEGEVILHNKEIKERLHDLAEIIAQKYRGQNLHIVGLLKGAAIVTTDLVQALWEAGLDDITYDFMEVSSYGKEKVSSGKLNILKDVTPESIADRHVLLVDDVADSNRTMQGIYNHLLEKKASSIETFALLEKPAKREVDFIPDYVGFKIPNVWVEGYGMDSPVEYMGRVQEIGRANPHIVKGPTSPGMQRQPR